MIAVVLAAGKGSRLGNYTTDLPKSLLPLNNDGLTLLDYNLKILQEFKLEKIIIITGFNSGKIEEHVTQYENIEIVYNPFWNHCNVLGSLYMGLDKIKDDFLFLHADTLAVKEIWDMLIAVKGDMVLPIEHKECGEEEMKVTIANGKITRISKLIDPKDAAGEFLGIAKFKKETIPYFKSKAEEFFKSGELNNYMEAVVQAAIEDNEFLITPPDVSDLNFVEVDFEEDYLRAKELFG